MYNKDITKNETRKGNKMTIIEKASNKVNELVQSGVELNEAIQQVSEEFNVSKETLLIEWDF